MDRKSLGERDICSGFIALASPCVATFYAARLPGA